MKARKNEEVHAKETRISEKDNNTKIAYHINPLGENLIIGKERV